MLLWKENYRRLRLLIVRTLREDQPLRLLLNLLFYHFKHSEPTYKSQRTELLDVIATCSQLNVNAPIDINNNLFLGEISQIVSYWKQISDCRQLVPFVQPIIKTFFSCFFGNWKQCSACYQLYGSQRLIFSQCTYNRYLNNISILPLYEQFSRNVRNFDHFWLSEKISNS